MRKLLAGLLGGHGALTKGSMTTVAGHKVIALQDASKHGTLYVATSGKPYPIQISNTGANGGQLTFSRFDTPVALAAPAHSIDLSKLQEVSVRRPAARPSPVPSRPRGLPGYGDDGRDERIEGPWPPRRCAPPGWTWGLARGRVVNAVGGPARTRVVVLFGCVLALSSAQISTVGAVAPQLESSLHLDNTQIGLLNSVTLIVAAVAVIPVGLLVDRIKRVPDALDQHRAVVDRHPPGRDREHLRNAAAHARDPRRRLGVGRPPAIASLTGDYFPSRERGRVYGYILTGEILGTAVGFIICGNASAAFRLAGVVLGARRSRASSWPGSCGAPCPNRCAAATAAWSAAPIDLARPNANVRDGAVLDDAPPRPKEQDLAFELAEEQGYRPDPKLILDRDPDRMSLIDAVRYILSIPTNTMLIISSSLGYFFFSGLETFATVFVRGHFPHQPGARPRSCSACSCSARSSARSSPGRSATCSRVTAGSPRGCGSRASATSAPAWRSSRGCSSPISGTALPFCFIGTALISAANPPLDAAPAGHHAPGPVGARRVDADVPAARSPRRSPRWPSAASPTLISGFTPHQAPVGTHTGQIVSGTGTGLQISFLIMLVTLIGAGWFLFKARPTYPHDVATAAAGWSPLPPNPDAPPGPDGGGPPAPDGPGPAGCLPPPREAGVMVTDRRTEDPTVVVARATPRPWSRRARIRPWSGQASPRPSSPRDEDPTVVAGGEDSDRGSPARTPPSRCSGPATRRPRR